MQTIVTASDHVEVKWAGREFGGQETPTSQFQRKCPEALRVVAAELYKQSALVKLDDSADNLTKQMVFDAYASDLHLLQRHVSEFEACIKSAARASILLDSKEDEASKETDAMWAELDQQPPPLNRQRPLLALPNTLAAKEASNILRDLRLQFEDSVQHIVRLFTYWLHALTEEEVVGLMEWSDVDIGRYHYFCRIAKERTLNESHHDEVEGTQRKKIRERIIHQERFFDRHIHHLVDAKLHSVKEYKKAMPARVKQFLKTVPAWLKPHLQIVDGQMTMEEVVRCKTADKTEVNRDVIATYRYDPAVCLGDFTLLGWTEGETAREQLAKKEWEPGIVGVALIGLFSLICFVYGFAHGIHDIGRLINLW